MAITDWLPTSRVGKPDGHHLLVGTLTATPSVTLVAEGSWTGPAPAPSIWWVIMLRLQTRGRRGVSATAPGLNYDSRNWKLHRPRTIATTESARSPRTGRRVSRILSKQLGQSPVAAVIPGELTSRPCRSCGELHRSVVVGPIDDTFVRDGSPHESPTLRADRLARACQPAAGFTKNRT